MGLILGFIASIVGMDQGTKALAKSVLLSSGARIYAGGMFRLQYSENPGAFLSLGADLGERYRFWIFSVFIPSFLLLVSFFLFLRKASGLFTAGLTMVVAGGLGNLIDRINQGRVVDFMNIGIGDIRTGI